MNFPITVASNGTAVGTFYLGYITSPVRGNTSLYRSCSTHRPNNAGLKTILNAIAGTNAWGSTCDCYVGTSVSDGAKLGFRVRAHKNTTNHRINVYFQDPETSAFFYFYFPDCDNAQKDMYLCLPYIGEGDAFAEVSVENKTALRMFLKLRMQSLYTAKTSNLWRYGMGRFNTAILVPVMHDGTRAELYPDDTERPMYDLGIDETDDRGFYHNLSTFANWFHFMMGSFAYNVQYVETVGGKKIYLSKSLSQVNNDHMYRDGATSNTAYYQYSDADNKPTYSYDFQSGTDLRTICSTPGTEVILTNGSSITCRKRDTLDGRYYYYYEITHAGEEGHEAITISTAFNARRQVGDLAGTNYTGSFAADDLYSMPGGNDSLILQHVGFWVSPLVEGGVEAYIDDNEGFGNEGLLNNFWNSWPTAPITIGGVYFSSWTSVSSTYSTWEDRVAAWGRSSPTIPLMVSNISGYLDPNDTAFNKLINLFSTIHVSPASGINISALLAPNAGRMNVDTANNTKILWGINDVIDPDIPDSGTGSIGGGSGSSHSGGSGTFDDSGDTVSTLLPATFGSTGTLVNYYIGELGSSELSQNLERLGEWFALPINLSASDFSGIFYNYSDKLNNICSMKVMFTPDHAITDGTGYKNINIHGDPVNGGVGTATMQGVPVTNEFNQTTVVLNFKLTEYFNSFLDYAPYTRVQIYLPFAGVHELNPSDIVGNAIKLTCTVDFLSGDIVYNITVNTGTCQSVLYTFAGNCSVALPLTAANYDNVVSGLSKALIGAAVAGASGGSGALLAGASGAMGAADIINSGKTSVKGSFGGTAGAMSPLQCYLIVTRPKMVKAKDYGDINGYPCMQSYRLNEVEGYVKIAECNWAIPGATEEEINELDEVMKSEGAIFGNPLGRY